MFHQLKVATRNGDGAATVILDGLNIADAVYGLEVVFRPDEKATAILSLLPDHTYYQGAVKVRFPKPTEDLLLQLGWTPPPPDPPEGGGDGRT